MWLVLSIVFAALGERETCYQHPDCSRPKQANIFRRDNRVFLVYFISFHTFHSA